MCSSDSAAIWASLSARPVCNIEKARILCRRFCGFEIGEVLLPREEA